MQRLMAYKKAELGRELDLSLMPLRLVDSKKGMMMGRGRQKVTYERKRKSREEFIIKEYLI